MTCPIGKVSFFVKSCLGLEEVVDVLCLELSGDLLIALRRCDEGEMSLRTDDRLFVTVIALMCSGHF